MSKDKLIAPVLKWVGGKRQLLDTLRPLLPKEITAYCEPFIGGGAMLFDLQPQIAFINDANKDLMNVYDVIKNDVESLITALQGFRNEATFFYKIRAWDRDRVSYESRTAVERAARILYLNKTCYNGLYRVNSAGEFNSPFGHYRNPNIVNTPKLRAVSTYLNAASLRMTVGDYTAVLQSLPHETFVYIDPPYDPVSGTANFTGYAQNGFSRGDQITLRIACDELNARGIKFMLSNSATDFIQEQYSAYDITIVHARRAVNSNASKRGAVAEVVVRNYT